MGIGPGRVAGSSAALRVAPDGITAGPRDAASTLVAAPAGFSCERAIEPGTAARERPAEPADDGEAGFRWRVRSSLGMRGSGRFPDLSVGSDRG
jgi:hypothetical protein